LFTEKPQWSLAELEQALKLEKAKIVPGLNFWLGKGTLLPLFLLCNFRFFRTPALIRVLGVVKRDDDNFSINEEWDGNLGNLLFYRWE
jgi:hypothetical protein